MKNSIQFSAVFFIFSLFLGFNSCKKEDCSPTTKNTETVKKLFGFFAMGDISSFLNGSTTDCIFDVTGNQILNPGKVYFGHSGFMEFLGDLSKKGQPTLLTPIDFYESGNVVTVLGKIEFTEFASGKKCKVNFIQLWKFNSDGKMIYFKEDHDNRVCE
ncbi:MAG: nuclear transport factor 2 family protein [Saprospiraceae bacterium]